MPRLARLDAPGVLHHIIIRGIERRKIFRDDKDRDDFIDRLSDLFLGDALQFCSLQIIINMLSGYHAKKIEDRCAWGVS